MQRIGVISARRSGNMIFLPEDILLLTSRRAHKILGIFEKLRVVAGFRKGQVESVQTGIVCRVPIRRVNFWVNVGGDFEHFDSNPVKSFSPGSKAVYYFQGLIDPDWGILIQKLPPASKTSSHCHRERDEWVFPLFGFAIAKNSLIEERVPLLSHDIIWFSPEIYHSLETPPNHAFVSLIVMKGVKTIEEILQGDHMFYQGA